MERDVDRGHSADGVLRAGPDAGGRVRAHGVWDHCGAAQYWENGLCNGYCEAYLGAVKDYARRSRQDCLLLIRDVTEILALACPLGSNGNPGLLPEAWRRAGQRAERARREAVGGDGGPADRD